MYIILLNGHVSCLKTTLSYYISSHLGLAHVTTSVMGDFSVNRKDKDFIKKREIRYNKALVIIETYLKHGVSVVVDGNYPYKYLRNDLYNVASSYGVKDIISLKCFSTDEEIIKQRLHFRLNNKFTPDSKANIIEAYHGSINEYEEINNDSFNGEDISSIEFDSGKFQIELLRSNDNMSKTVYSLVKKLIENNILQKPFFIV